MKIESQEILDARPLLAKSLPPLKSVDKKDPSTWPASVFLAQHLQDVGDVARVVCELCGRGILENVGLEPETWLPRLERCLVLAGQIHDLGKANGRFQAMVRGDKSGLERQPVRHEALSVYLCLSPDGLRSALFPSGSLGEHPVEACAVIAVLGHHVKYCVRGPALQPGISDPNAVGKIRLMWAHPDFATCLAVSGLSLTKVHNVEPERDDILEGKGTPGLYDLVDELYDFLLGHEIYRGSDPMTGLSSEWGRFLALIKALLVTCDVTASAVPRRGLKPAEWMREALARRPDRDALQAILDAGLGDNVLHDFQQKLAAARKRVTVTIAGCGSGKTVGAYAWARERAVGRKVFVAYPTTGTATEGFGDYLLGVQEDAELVHGRAVVDLESLLRNQPVLEDDEDADEEIWSFSGLEMLSASMTVCTADAVLGLMQNHRRGLSCAAALASGAFVFDEIHAYDPSMWEALLTFLELFPNAPVLLMSATIPEHRKKELVDRIGSDALEFIQGPKDHEERRRYLPIQRGTARAALELARGAAADGKRVLIVANTVGRCMAYRDELVSAGVEPLVYHSRFRYKDRVEQHREVIKAFKGEDTPGGVVAVTTQVAEMSLDLDADLLITELAPASALIQRMGRLNRKAKEGTPARPCFVIELNLAKESRPYPEGELSRAVEWLEALPSGELSQAHLADAFKRVVATADKVTLTPPITLITSPVEANRGRLRDSGVTGTFLLKKDAEYIDSLQGQAEKTHHAISSALPMILPRRKNFQSWRREGMAYVIPDSHVDYDEKSGAKWKWGQGGRSA